jgi:ureidoacrylate peracid hydrolase
MNALSRTEASSEGIADWIRPGRAALLVIDMQVDFAAPHGAVGGWGVDLSTVPPALAAAETLTKAARTAGVPVIFVGLRTAKDTDSPAWNERMRRRGGDPDNESGLCRAGEPGADFYGPTPEPGERVIDKTRYSGFYGTDLDSHLKALGVDTVVACGLTTECCVDSTVRDAFHLDYHVFVAEDACAAYEADIHQGALKILELNCAILASSADIARVWTEAASHG